MEEQFHWFYGKNFELKPKLKPKSQINYKELVCDKKKLLLEIKNNPDILFEIVDSYSVCMCGGKCGNCLYEDKYFIQLIIEYKSIIEQDIIDIKDIDLFKLTKYLPFSISTLQKYHDKVDWNEISKSYLYNKSTEFIKLFWNKLDWNNVCNLYTISNKDIIDLTFVEHKIPIDFALSKKMIPIDYLKFYIDKISLPKYIPILIKKYGAEFIEKYIDIYLINNDINSHLFMESCCEKKYIPKTEKYIDLLKSNWIKFIANCNPGEEFIDKYIAPSASKNVWDFLSGDSENYNCNKFTNSIFYIPKNITFSMDFITKYKSKLNFKILMKYQQFDIDTIKEHYKSLNPEVISEYQKLTPEFIDEYANDLDWYSLCEFQELPDWLLRKHIDKINWGQISLYQKLRVDFIKEFRSNLNEIKMEKNIKIIK
jgi:hypothetical protein